MANYAELLSHVSIFQHLEPAALDRLGARLKVMSFNKEALIVSQSDPGDSMFIIDQGRVKVVLYGDSGREVILSIFRSGEFFGEMSLLDGQPRSANVIALEDSKLLVLSRDDFVKHLNEFPSTALNILAEMSTRLRRADEVIGNLALLDVYARVARILVDLAKTDGRPTDEGIVIRERPTQQDLAAMIGTSRETVSRVLSEFQRRGLLSMRGKTILLSHGFAEQQLSHEE
jgi:CRP/FNR family transcriptional regulator, cyclic AMP receptor protein